MDLQIYQQHKGELTELIKRYGKSGLQQRPQHGFVGLWNQGSTCYLNSVLQALLTENDIVQKLASDFASLSDTNKELCRLACEMRMTDQAALSTQRLTDVFGWKNGQLHDQHDAHEFFSMIVDQLPEPCKQLFAIKMKDSITCPNCNGGSSQVTTNYSLSIDVPDVGAVAGSVDTTTGESAASGTVSGTSTPLGSEFGSAAPSTKLTELISRCFEPEELDSNNMWACDACEKKVQGLKSQQIETYPQQLMIQLKRFRFDPSSRRRRKLTNPVLFPMELTVTESATNDVSVVFALTSVLVHTGTAQGGHYQTYHRDLARGKWYDYNDAVVSELDIQEEAALFWYQNPNAPAATGGGIAGEDGVASKRNLLYENAYVLVYSRADSAVGAVSFPEELVAQVTTANAKFKELQQAYEIMKSVIGMTVIPVRHDGVPIAGAAPVTLELDISITQQEALEAIVAAVRSHGLADATVANVRLRKYNVTTRWLMETYDADGALSAKLEALGFEGTSQMTLALEVKADGETFAPFNPKEMRVRVYDWDALWSAGYASGSSESADAGLDSSGVSSVALIVPGEDAATALQLREALSQHLSVPANRINVIKCSQRKVVLLEDDAKSLGKDYAMVPDEEVIVEIIPETANSDRSTYPSVALEKMLQLRRNIAVCFNKPEAAGESGGAEVDDPSSYYSLTVKVPLETTLADVKALMGKALQLDPSEFHLRRNRTAPQLKDESKTLEELEFVNLSVIHVQLGAGCKPGELMLRFELDVGLDGAADVSNPYLKPTVAEGVVNNTFVLGDLKVKEKMTVAQIKQQLYGHMTELAAGANASALPFVLPPSVNHLRLRDGKNKGSGGLGGPLRDERIISRCLLNLEDGRRIVVQVLKEAEVITSDDLILSLRIASYYNKTLSKPIDYPINRNTTVQNLYQHILERYPYLGEEVSMVEQPAAEESAAAPSEFATSFKPAKLIAIAKGFSTGPPLTLKSALKLKWNDELILKDMEANPANTIDKMPMNLRDGSVLVVRSQADFERAKSAAMQAKKLANANGEPAGTLTSSNSSGNLRTRLASRGGTRSTRASSLSSSREPSLKIPSPIPMSGEVGESGIPAGAPVRMVKALKDSSGIAAE